MRNYFNVRRIGLILSVMFFMSSCKEKNDNTTGTETNTSSAASTNTVAVPEKAITLSGTLDTLWVEAAKFKTLANARLVLSFAVAGPDTLTLYGWSCKNSGGSCTGEFNTDPDLKLEKGRASDVDYGPIVFWENLILHKKEVKDIQDKIGTAFSYVLFAPENKNGHIRYSIILTGKDPKDINATSTFADEDTGFDANPSPPKNTSN